MFYLNKKRFLLSLLLVTTLALSNPVAKAEDIDDQDYTNEVSDPLESMNRAIYQFNHILDIAILKPVAKTYQFIFPKLVRQGVHNVVINLSEPVTFLNSTLQGDQEQAFTTFWRFAINSTYGLGGVFDVAKDAGLKYRKEDFGQTQAVYGVGQGVYLMLPILGPSNARDAVGLVADAVSDPFTYLLDDEAMLVTTGVTGLDKRESTLELIDHIESTSLDPYATIRSLYTQKRWDDVRNGNRK